MTAGNDFQLMHIVFVPVTLFFEDELDISENCGVSTLGLLPSTLQSKASWRIDIFVLEKVTMVITNMRSGWLSVACFVQGIFLFGGICVCHTKWRRFGNVFGS